jgi:ribosomal protein L40E
MHAKFSAASPDESIDSCRSCGAKDLYLQKDFPRKIAIPVVIVAALLVPWTYGISLIVAAVIDFIIYRRTKWMTVCYKCQAEYRGFALNPAHKEFDRHLDELYRYGES